MFDADGNRYVDLVQSWGALLFGHARPEIVEAARAAAGRGTTFGAPTELEVELAERITAAMPSVEMVRLVSSGTEAGMSAIRLARGFTGRDLVLKFEAVTTDTRTRCSRREPGAAWRRSGSRARQG